MRSKEELAGTAAALRHKMETLRYDVMRKKAKNVKEIGWVRRDIARIMTVLREK